MIPEHETMERVKRDRAEGKAPSMQAGEFIREEMHHIREGKHGARSSKQAIAIGLSKARRAGVALRPPQKGSAKLRHKAKLDLAKGGHSARRHTSSRRGHATLRALRREGHAAASSRSLSRQAASSARQRTAGERSAAARRAARTRARERR
jgi:hypothetical protein